MEYDKYFEWRRVTPDMYAKFTLPAYLCEVLPKDKNSLIVDFGCGFGQTLLAIREKGYTNIAGIDISLEAIDFCEKQNLKIYKGFEDVGLSEIKNKGGADFLIASHVIEHIPKEEIIPTLEKLFSLLKPGGKLLVMVPNAQSNTDAYWRYEDFTHHILFTSGSIYYVLRAAGFSKISFLDIDCTSGGRRGIWIIKIMIKTLLWFYKLNKKFWNVVTRSIYHGPSEDIYSFEIKVLAEKTVS